MLVPMRRLLAVTITLAALAALPAGASAGSIWLPVPELPDANAVTLDNLQFIGVYGTRFLNPQESHAHAAEIFLRDCSRNPSNEWWQKVSRSRELMDDVVEGWTQLQPRVRELAGLTDKTPVSPAVRGQLQELLARMTKDAGEMTANAVRLRGIFGDLKRFDCGVGARLDRVRAETKGDSDRFYKALATAEDLVR